jgi:hypothetical protein
MQKLSRKTMDMLYKSCRVFHTESNIIGFAFFWIFYKFLCISQVSVTLLILFKIQLYTEVPGNFWFFTNVPLVCTKDSGNSLRLAMRPLGHGRRRLRPNSGEERAGEGRGWVKEGQGLTTGRFVTGGRADRVPVSGLGGARHQRPLRW